MPIVSHPKSKAAATPKAKASDKTPKASKPRQTKPKKAASGGPTTPTKSASRPPRPLPSTVYKEDPESDSGSSSSEGGSDIYEPVVGGEPDDADEIEDNEVLQLDELGEEEDPVTDEEPLDDMPQTPRKQRAGASSPTKRGRPRKDAGAAGPKTPSRPRTKGIAAPTPHSKAALRKRRNVIDLSRLRGASNTGM